MDTRLRAAQRDRTDLWRLEAELRRAGRTDEADQALHDARLEAGLCVGCGLPEHAAPRPMPIRTDRPYLFWSRGLHLIQAQPRGFVLFRSGADGNVDSLGWSYETYPGVAPTQVWAIDPCGRALGTVGPYPTTPDGRRELRERHRALWADA